MQNAVSHPNLSGLDQTEVRDLSERLSSALTDAGVEPAASTGDAILDAEALLAQAEEAGIAVPASRRPGMASGVPQHASSASTPDGGAGLTATQRVLLAKGVKTWAELGSRGAATEAVAPKAARPVESSTSAPGLTATQKVLAAKGFSTFEEARAAHRAKYGEGKIPPGMTATEAVRRAV